MGQLVAAVRIRVTVELQHARTRAALRHASPLHESRAELLAGGRGNVDAHCKHVTWGVGLSGRRETGLQATASAVNYRRTQAWAKLLDE